MFCQCIASFYKSSSTRANAVKIHDFKFPHVHVDGRHLDLLVLVKVLLLAGRHLDGTLDFPPYLRLEYVYVIIDFENVHKYVTT